ncbi:ABC transport system ATP-binding protein [Thermotomaculum hydrothermale]|uniref:ABC transport system ATP-binding protein n=1 Tax=Thermotomaculum hydrothermale TaxID=981385 RepID=A0A7R6PQV2_9BACT|nr:ATP-binding cassette domain-containing protein [Thermotomaculum hydrothermale]BBB32666.1 ABC transport system ATP-binding protein [Thermotomaculum hydrothermale]
MNVVEMKLRDIFEKQPVAKDFFDSIGIEITDDNLTLNQYIENVDEEKLEDLGLSKEFIIENFKEFLNNLQDIESNELQQVKSITIIGGYNKLGEKEDIEIEIKAGEIVSIVGPTGSGKSRLLADIEWMAQGDTPTKRHILLNGEVPDRDLRFSSEFKLVAQLSQNMNFVIDLSVREFLILHAESRYVQNKEEIVEKVIEKANHLAGESFTGDTPLTSLSGGQSRALMIADTAILSKSPIILIDEIENAGIDRKKALDLLVEEQKIVLMATHDPILALMGDKRFVISHGGIVKILETTKEERELLKKLEELDKTLLEYRNRLRLGERLS